MTAADKEAFKEAMNRRFPVADGKASAGKSVAMRP